MESRAGTLLRLPEVVGAHDRAHRLAREDDMLLLCQLLHCEGRAEVAVISFVQERDDGLDRLRTRRMFRCAPAVAVDDAFLSVFLDAPFDALGLAPRPSESGRSFRVREVSVNAGANNVAPLPLFRGECGFHMTRMCELICSPSCRSHERDDIFTLRGVTFSLWYYSRQDFLSTVNCQPFTFSGGRKEVLPKRRLPPPRLP